jgi:hypothetical protein
LFPHPREKLFSEWVNNSINQCPEDRTEGSQADCSGEGRGQEGLNSVIVVCTATKEMITGKMEKTVRYAMRKS